MRSDRVALFGRQILEVGGWTLVGCPCGVLYLELVVGIN